jgi:hypothetical protein
LYCLCSSLVLERLPFNPIFQPSSVVGGLADGLPAVRGQSARGVSVTDGPRCLRRRSIIVGAVLEVCDHFRTIRRYFADGPPWARR